MDHYVSGVYKWLVKIIITLWFWPLGRCFLHLLGFLVSPVVPVLDASSNPSAHIWVLQQNFRRKWNTYSRSFRGWALQMRHFIHFESYTWNHFCMCCFKNDIFPLTGGPGGPGKPGRPCKQEKCNQQCCRNSRVKPRLNGDSLSLLQVLWGPLDQKGPADSNNNTVSHRHDW